MKHQIFIASYAKDSEWLIYCLASLRKFAQGFLPPVVCVSQADFDEFSEFCPHFHPKVKVVVKDGTGFMRAQIAMMEADLFCPEAEVIYLMGSDCIALRTFGSDIYCPRGKPVVLMNSRELLVEARAPCLPWLRGTERVLGFAPDYEYMRRLPSVYPAEIFSAMRFHVEQLHGMAFEDYIIEGDKSRHDTSEANILGAYAHRFAPFSCEWVNVDNVKWAEGNPVGFPSAIGQLWSHGGLDRPSDACFTYETKGEKRLATGRLPRHIIADVLG